MHFPSLGEKKDTTGYDGGPLGNADFIAGRESILGRRIAKRALAANRAQATTAGKACRCKLDRFGSGNAFHIPVFLPKASSVAGSQSGPLPYSAKGGFNLLLPW